MQFVSTACRTLHSGAYTHIVTSYMQPIRLQVQSSSLADRTSHEPALTRLVGTAQSDQAALISLVRLDTDTLSQGYTNLQSLVKCLPYRHS